MTTLHGGSFEDFGNPWLGPLGQYNADCGGKSKTACEDINRRLFIPRRSPTRHLDDDILNA